VNQSNKPGFFDIVLSVIAAAVGIQSSRNRIRDFGGGSATPYIIGGVIFTILFILAIVAVVKMVVSH
jgi:hypothetical protein